VALPDDLERVASIAAAYANGDVLVAVLATEPVGGSRRYLCAFENIAAGRTWLALDDSGVAVTGRRDVRDAVSIAALCEVAEENAFPGDLDELRAQLVALRIAEQPAGIDEAEEAALALQHVLGAAPTVATRARLDAIGIAARRLERALDPTAASPFAVAMQSSQPAVEELVREVETGYRLPLDTGE
jgi:hypothetical protein